MGSHVSTDTVQHNHIIQKSREEFENTSKKDMEEAIKLSIQETHKNIDKNFVKSMNEQARQFRKPQGGANIEDNNFEKAIKESLQNNDEEEFLK